VFQSKRNTFFGVRQHDAALPLRDMSRGFSFVPPAVFVRENNPINTNPLRTTCRATAKRRHATALQRTRLFQFKVHLGFLQLPQKS
jgi:hypothetical protein